MKKLIEQQRELLLRQKELYKEKNKNILLLSKINDKIMDYITTAEDKGVITTLECNVLWKRLCYSWSWSEIAKEYDTTKEKVRYLFEKAYNKIIL